MKKPLASAPHENMDHEDLIQSYAVQRVKNPFAWHLYLDAAKLMIEKEQYERAQLLLKDLIFVNSHVKDNSLKLPQAQKLEALNLLHSAVATIENQKEQAREERFRKEYLKTALEIEREKAAANKVEPVINLPPQNGFFASLYSSIFGTFSTRPRIVPVSAPANDAELEQQQRHVRRAGI